MRMDVSGRRRWTRARSTCHCRQLPLLSAPSGGCPSLAQAPVSPPPAPSHPAGRTCSVPTWRSWPRRRTGSDSWRPSSARQNAAPSRSGGPQTSGAARCAAAAGQPASSQPGSGRGAVLAGEGYMLLYCMLAAALCRFLVPVTLHPPTPRHPGAPHPSPPPRPPAPTRWPTSRRCCRSCTWHPTHAGATMQTALHEMRRCGQLLLLQGGMLVAQLCEPV